MYASARRVASRSSGDCDAGYLGSRFTVMPIFPFLAAFVERRGQIPMVERDVRLDPALQQLVDKPRIEIDSLFVDSSGSLGIDAAPRDAESISVRSQLGHDRNIVLVAPVVVAGNVARLIEPGVARSVRETVPDAATGAITGRGAFDLVGRGAGSPKEIVGESEVFCHLGGPLISARSGIHKTEAGSCKLTKAASFSAFIPA